MLLCLNPAKMCVVELSSKLYCTENVWVKFTALIKEKIPVSDKQSNITGIPENLLHLLIRFVQNYISPFSIWNEFSAKTCFV